MLQPPVISSGARAHATAKSRDPGDANRNHAASGNSLKNKTTLGLVLAFFPIRGGAGLQACGKDAKSQGFSP